MTYHRVVTRVTIRVPLVEQEMLNLSEDMSEFIPGVFGVCVAQSLIFRVVICNTLFVLLSLLLLTVAGTFEP